MNIKFGTKLKLKKDWEVGFITIEKGDIVNVALYSHKYGMKFYCEGISNLLDFNYGWNNREEKINEWFEIVEEFDDKLAELEKVILDYYLDKGYLEGLGDWGFGINIITEYKKKEIYIELRYGSQKSDFHSKEQTTKEMFDKAFEYFSSK